MQESPSSPLSPVPSDILTPHESPHAHAESSVTEPEAVDNNEGAIPHLPTSTSPVGSPKRTRKHATSKDDFYDDQETKKLKLSPQPTNGVAVLNSPKSSSPDPAVADQNGTDFDIDDPSNATKTIAEDIGADGKVGETSVMKTSLPISSGRKQPIRGNWSALHLLSNPKSKLASINLTELLSSERAWTELTRSEQSTLISLLPGMSDLQLPQDEALPNVLKPHIKSNSSFQADIRLFQEDLSLGRYDPKWIEDAKKASQKRKEGTFDDWKEKNQEEFWGQKQKMDRTALAGESRMHDFATLIRAGLFLVDDIWSLRRGMGMGANNIVVEKEATLTHIAETKDSLSFRFPPGQRKFSTMNIEDKIVDNVSTPLVLSDAILNEDGRIVGVRGANSWMEFRCIRKNQDMGTLWDIRELYHLRKSR